MEFGDGTTNLMFARDFGKGDWTIVFSLLPALPAVKYRDGTNNDREFPN